MTAYDENNNLYVKAVNFAAKAHDGQKRKGDGAPYIVHPFIVASILREQQCSPQAVIAGLLHDTVEDTHVTIEELETEFGADVAAIVATCTEQDKSLHWELRKQHSIATIKTASLDAKYVTCADKLHNLNSLTAAYQKMGDEVWSRFSRGYDSQKWYAESMLHSILFGLDAADMKPMMLHYKKLVEDFYKK